MATNDMTTFERMKYNLGFDVKSSKKQRARQLTRERLVLQRSSDLMKKKMNKEMASLKKRLNSESEEQVRRVICKQIVRLERQSATFSGRQAVQKASALISESSSVDRRAQALRFQELRNMSYDAQEYGDVDLYDVIEMSTELEERHAVQGEVAKAADEALNRMCWMDDLEEEDGEEQEVNAEDALRIQELMEQSRPQIRTLKKAPSVRTAPPTKEEVDEMDILSSRLASIKS